MNIASLLTERNIKKIILTLAVMCLCGIECYKTNGSYEEAAFFVNFIGVSVFAFTAFRFKLRDFLKPLYYVYAGLGLVLIPVVYHFFAELDVFASRFLIAEFNVYLFGFVIIRLAEMFLTKVKSGSVTRPSVLFFAWALMMLLCVFSVNNSVWPLWFLMIFTCYYLVPVTEEEQEDIFEAIVNGLILGFFVIQSLAFLYRPFGYPRYRGFFFNSNMNSLFYLVSYAALLVKLHMLGRSGDHKVLRVAVFLLSCSMWSFVWLTAGRSAFLGFIAITIVYLVIDKILINKKGFIGFLVSGAIMFVVFVASTFPVYACIRYIPELRHHPVFFLNEYEDAGMIKSEDIHDSDRYVKYIDAYMALVGRLDYDQYSASTIHDDTIETTDETAVNDSYYKSVSYGKADVILGIRKYAWMYYGSHLNLVGHEESFQTIRITPLFSPNHPHNSFLFIAYGYGIIPGIMFLIWVFGMPVYLLIRYFKEREKVPVYCMVTLFAYMAFIFYGFFETSSYPGRVVFELLFLTALPFMKKANIKGTDESLAEKEYA